MKLALSGIIYRGIIDPILFSVQRHIVDYVNNCESLIDIACGTGSLSIALSEKAGTVHGIDLAEEMIYHARKRVEKLNKSNVSFDIQDASDLSHIGNDVYDVSITSMAVHQFDPGLAIKILEQMKRISSRVIIMDYTYPLRGMLWPHVINLVEWVAGGDHFRNFRKFKNLGGLDYYLEKSGLGLDYSTIYQSGAFRVVVL